MQTRTYPRRLIRAMMWQAILTPSEARSAVVAHRQHDGRYGGSEAVVHYGGATKIIREAFRNRHVANEIARIREANRVAAATSEARRRERAARKASDA